MPRLILISMTTLLLVLSACSAPVESTPTATPTLTPSGPETTPGNVATAKATATPLPELTPTPNLPTEFLTKVPLEAYSYDATGLHITMDNGQTVLIPSSEIADRLKPGEAGSQLVLGDLLPNPTEEASRPVVVYYDGSQWVTPEAWRNMRYTPELMKIKGESIPAVIEAVTVTEDQSDQLASIIPGELIMSAGEITSGGSGDFQNMTLDHLVLTQRTTEKITTFPGVTTREKAMYQTYLNYMYLVGRNVHHVQILAKGRFSSGGYGADSEIITDDASNTYYEIGKSYYLSIGFPVSTSPFNQGKFLAYSQTDYPNPGIDTYYAYWGIGSELYTYDQIKTALETSGGVVSFEKFLINEITKNH